MPTSPTRPPPGANATSPCTARHPPAARRPATSSTGSGRARPVTERYRGETAARLDLEFTIVVFNDDGYGLVAEHQREHRGDAFGTRLTNPHFERFAASFGIDGYRAETWSAVEERLAEAIPSQALTLIEIPLG